MQGRADLKVIKVQGVRPLRPPAEVIGRVGLDRSIQTDFEAG